MRTHRALLLPVLLMAACGTNPEDQVEIEPAGYPDPVVTAETRTVQLQDMVEQGITGELSITPVGDSVQFHLSIDNAAPDRTLSARIHTGTCENPGAAMEVLPAVHTGPLGHGREQRTMGAHARDFLDGRHIAAVYAQGAEAGRDRPIACGVIQAAGTGPGSPGSPDGTPGPPAQPDTGVSGAPGTTPTS